MAAKEMIQRKTWKEFQENGLLWWINTILHMFGWAIVIQYGDNQEIEDVYPARVKFRGFNEQSNTQGYINVSKYLTENIDELLKEAEE